MSRFVKKQVEVEAVQWTGENGAEVAALLGLHPNDLHIDRGTILAGNVAIARLDYLLIHTDGERESVGWRQFEATYEPADPPQTHPARTFGEDGHDDGAVTEAEALATATHTGACDFCLKDNITVHTFQAGYSFCLSCIATAKAEEAKQHPQPGEDRAVARTGHEIGAIYESRGLGGGAYLVLGETDSGEVEVEQVVKGRGGKHYAVGDRWTHRTALDHCSRKIGYTDRSPHPGEGEGREAVLRDALLLVLTTGCDARLLIDALNHGSDGLQDAHDDLFTRRLVKTERCGGTDEYEAHLTKAGEEFIRTALATRGDGDGD